VKDSSDFQKLSNLVDNLAVTTVENVGKKSYFTSSIVIRELLKKPPQYLQQFAAWINEQNDVIFKVEIGNEARPNGSQK
jgi:hypothetical protein